MKQISKVTQDFLEDSYIDAIDIGIVDFDKKTFESKLFSNPLLEDEKNKIYFDLASVSKPLVNGIGFLACKKQISDEMKLVLNHQGGLPSWGLLSKDTWKDTILNYKIQKSKTLYSDFSALRFYLECEKLGLNLKKECENYWDSEIVFWKDLKDDFKTVQNGFVKQKENFRAVHDPNAYNLDEFVSHAGLFGTANGVAKTLLKLDKDFNLLDLMDESMQKDESRFVNSWDRVEDISNTFAGIGCSNRTFGHLGFTGTSIWIDCKKKLGHIILSNATKLYWYDKKSFNRYRKTIGELVWQNYS